jgi:hypothetical protein
VLKPKQVLVKPMGPAWELLTSMCFGWTNFTGSKHPCRRPKSTDKVLSTVVGIADEAPDSKEREFLLRMAEQWKRLADYKAELEASGDRPEKRTRRN